MANTKITASLLDPAQTNITSLGTLSALTISGNLTVDTSTLKVDSSNNRVGIGTATPQWPLQIDSDDDLTDFTSTTNGTLMLRNTDYNTGDYTALDFGYSSYTHPIGRIGLKITGSGSYLAFGTSNSYSQGVTNEAMTIDYNSNVGIGTTSPAYALDVDSTIHIGNDGDTGYTHSRLIFDSNGSVRGAGSFFHNQANDVEYFAGNPYNAADSFAVTRKATTASHDESTADVTNAIFKLSGDGAINLPSHGITLDRSFGSGVATITMLGTGANGRAGAILFQEQGASNTAAIYSTDGGTGNATYGGLTIATYQSDLRFATNGLASTRMIIDSSGKVGIGTTTLDKFFNLADPNNGGEQNKLHFEATGATHWAIYPYDRVNNHYPSLHLGQNENLKILNTGAVQIGNSSDGVLFQAKPSDGRVGIGTTQPGGKLMIEADGSVVDILVINNTRSGSNSTAIQQFKREGTNTGFIANTSSATSYATSQSDRRAKKNFEDWTENVLPYFKDLKPTKFHFTQEDDSSEKNKGYIAQDLVGRFPEAYPVKDSGEDADRYFFNPSGMVVYLMKAVQELSAEVESLKEKLNG